MWDFKFDAPQFHNFFRKIKLDPEDPDDQWFMQQHIELTPIKQQIKKLRPKKEGKHVELKLKQTHLTQIEKHRNNKIVKQNTKDSIKMQKKVEPEHKINKLKRLNLSDKHSNNTTQKSNSSRISAIQIKEQIQQIKPLNQIVQIQTQTNKLMITKSRSQTDLHQGKNKRLRIPCPYPLRVQRDWQTRSHKNWYNLTEQSTKKALESMKQLCKRKKNSPKKQKSRFKF